MLCETVAPRIFNLSASSSTLAISSGDGPAGTGGVLGGVGVAAVFPVSVEVLLAGVLEIFTSPDAEVEMLPFGVWSETFPFWSTVILPLSLWIDTPPPLVDMDAFGKSLSDAGGVVVEVAPFGFALAGNADLFGSAWVITLRGM